MAEVRDILTRFLGDAKGLNRATGDAQAGLSKTERAAQGASTGMSTLTRAAGALGIAFGAREIADFALDAAKAAEQANIVAESFNTTFGPAADGMRDSLEEVRRVMGLSSAAAETALLPLGQLSQAMGLSTEEGAGFSEQLFILAGDLAAFDGDLSDSEAALGAVQSALKGEFDPLEQFGIKLKQSDINAKALTMTGKALTSELTNQELALASLQLMLEQAGDETGALMAMQDSAQGQTNQLTSQLEDLKIQIGQGVNPALIAGTTALLEWMERAKEAGEASNRYAGAAELAIGFMYEWWSRTNLLGMAFRWLKGQVEDLISTVGDWIETIKDIPTTLLNPFRNWKLPNLTLPSWVPRFAEGGIVPGAPGQEVPAIVHGGEMILNQQQQRALSSDSGGGSNITINIGVAGDPYQTARTIADLLTQYEMIEGTRLSGISI